MMKIKFRVRNNRIGHGFPDRFRKSIRKALLSIGKVEFFIFKERVKPFFIEFLRKTAFINRVINKVCKTFEIIKKV